MLQFSLETAVVFFPAKYRILDADHPTFIFHNLKVGPQERTCLLHYLLSLK